MNSNFEIAIMAKETGINVDDIKKLRYKDVLTLLAILKTRSVNDNFFTVGKSLEKVNK
jgi:predicted amino acid-binding ACT domain protein